METDLDLEDPEGQEVLLTQEFELKGFQTVRVQRSVDRKRVRLEGWKEDLSAKGGILVRFSVVNYRPFEEAVPVPKQPEPAPATDSMNNVKQFKEETP